jgi:hypothetical protein
MSSIIFDPKCKVDKYRNVASHFNVNLISLNLKDDEEIDIKISHAKDHWSSDILYSYKYKGIEKVNAKKTKYGVRYEFILSDTEKLIYNSDDICDEYYLEEYRNRDLILYIREGIVINHNITQKQVDDIIEKIKF